ncbi:heme-responsive two-component system response regulator ChrA [Corynebacterium diphtheriae]|uniref:heme-responsive two-component system response regulator ChrA n=1 Tax=Corynebacterium diphtheriae TaxID=1717 RepID=UPI0002468BEB|nr:heme-responsive two-component system response regulator ChrA [Corynebacterium diphtheriae]AEX70951.1 two-component system response regulator involved in heme homeostasis [Corynebacterium diphtheriae PW8]KLN36976.1 LuxR family transcriptional regulator [Corynebacterium diphtheriae bv. gravis str. ISS 4060]MBG9263893.1 heme-responsive two-component system response regulator ChrA [Corynebacterium diphtheriae bv. gravis]OKY24310.1 LuxR family transcriptional regulator [Corynebacterium diphtheria
MIRVMLIDDHPVVRAGLRSILDSFDDITVVAEASDGSNINTKGIDVVVTDIQMPGTDGITLTRALASAGGPPVLILTTYDTEADILAAVEAGAMGYLLKDAPESALHDAVVATFEGRRTLAPEVANALMQRVSKPRQALSAREIEILQNLEQGLSNRQLAAKLFISEATVKTHLVHIYSKLGVDNRTAAITAARQQRLI